MEARSDNEDVEFILNQPKSSWMDEDFVAFEDSENDDAGEGNAGYAGHAEHDIADEFWPGDFF